MLLRSWLPRLFILVGLLAIIGCDRSSPPPTAPTPAPSQGAGPTASFKLTVDSLGSQDALMGVSEVTVDADVPTGRGLHYRVDFGDGTTAAEAVARHVYDKAGTYRITVTVTDTAGRTNATSRDLAVASPLGAWLYSGYIARTRTVEVRTLTLTAQEGTTVRGTLTRPGTSDAPVTGRLTPDRRISLTVDRLGETLEGGVPSVLTPNVAAWTLAARGGPVDGESLAFTPRPGEPTGPGPDATLRLQFGSYGGQYGIKQISPILFDASTSTGDGLTYFIEFGDREFAQAVTAMHPINEVGQYTARLTAVDRFGRVNAETVTYSVGSLVTSIGNYYFWQRADGTTQSVDLDIESQNGTAITGTLYYRTVQRPDKFSGTADADGKIRVVLAGSAGTLVGTMTLWSPDHESNLELTYAGGPRNGQRLKFFLRQGY